MSNLITNDNIVATFCFKVDSWSIGAISYVILSGRLPYTGKEREVAKKAVAANFSFSKPPWNEISADAKKFISKCMTKNPSDRPDMPTALQTDWLRDVFTYFSCFAFTILVFTVLRC